MLFGLFEDKNIIRDQDLFVTQVKNYIKNNNSGFILPKISLLDNIDLTNNTPLNSLQSKLVIIDSKINEIINKDLPDITGSNGMVYNHIRTQKSNYSSYSGKESEYNVLLQGKLFPFISENIFELFNPLNGQLKDMIKEFELFIVFESKTIEFVKELQQINSDLKFNSSGDATKLLYNLDILLQNIKKILEFKNNFPETFCVFDVKITNEYTLNQELTKLKDRTVLISKLIYNMQDAFIQISKSISGMAYDHFGYLKDYLSAMTDIWLTNFMTRLATEQYASRLADEPVILRYCQVTLNSIYSKIDLSFKNIIFCLAQNETMPTNLNINSKRKLESIFASFNAQKHGLIQERDYKIKNAYKKTVTQAINHNIVMKIIKDYDAGNYLGIRGTILSLNSNELKYADSVLKTVVAFDKGSKILFHSISPDEHNPDGSWSGNNGRLLSSKLYAERIYSVMKNGLRASTRSDSPFDYNSSLGELRNLQETYYFPMWQTNPIPAHNDLAWHYGPAAIIFDPRGKYAVHEIDRASQTGGQYVEEIILTNPKINIPSDGFVLVLNFSDGKYSKDYVIEVAKELDKLGIHYEKI